MSEPSLPSSSPSPPPPHVSMVAVRGTHYQVGLQLGRSFKTLCTEYYSASSFLPRYEEFYANEKEGREFCEELLETARARFPHYMDELAGMAEGAEIPYTKVLLLAIERELQVKLGLLDEMFSEDSNAHPQGCTDILVNTGAQMLIGHNEDWDAAMKNKDCVVMAHILPYESEDGRHFPEERFIVHAWPGLPLGLASGVNCHGLVYSIDHLYPKHTISTKKTADLFLSRHLLSATSLDNAKEILLDKGWGAAVGFSANMGCIHEDVLLNIEIGLNKNAAESLFSCVEIHANDKIQVNVHFNNFERLPVDSHVLSMCHGRANCFHNAPIPHDVHSLAQLLGDHSAADPAANIYQSPEAGFPWATLATVLYDLKQRKMMFYRGSAKDDPHPVITIPFPMLGTL